MNQKSNMIEQNLAESFFGEDTTGCSLDCRTDRIRKRAYELYVARGGRPGHPVDDWLKAEREINQRLSP